MKLFKSILIIALTLYFASCDGRLQNYDDPDVPSESMTEISEQADNNQIGAVERSPEYRAVVMDVQKELSERGYKVGDENGMLGPFTSNALEEFQERNQLEVTGMINEETMAALGLDPSRWTKIPAAGFSE